MLLLRSLQTLLATCCLSAITIIIIEPDTRILTTQIIAYTWLAPSVFTAGNGYPNTGDYEVALHAPTIKRDDQDSTSVATKVNEQGSALKYLLANTPISYVQYIHKKRLKIRSPGQHKEAHTTHKQSYPTKLHLRH
jgi:hypothetical protein